MKSKAKKTSTDAGKPLADDNKPFPWGSRFGENDKDETHSVGDEYGAPMWSHEHDASLNQHKAKQKEILPMHEATDFDCTDD